MALASRRNLEPSHSGGPSRRLSPISFKNSPQSHRRFRRRGHRLRTWAFIFAGVLSEFKFHDLARLQNIEAIFSDHRAMEINVRPARSFDETKAAIPHDFFDFALRHGRLCSICRQKNHRGCGTTVATPQILAEVQRSDYKSGTAANLVDSGGCLNRFGTAGHKWQGTHPHTNGSFGESQVKSFSLKFRHLLLNGRP